MGQISFTISLIMIALFTIAIIGFAVNFATDNDAAIRLQDDPELSSLDTATKTDLSTLRGKSEDTYQSIVESSIETGGETTTSGGQFALTPLTILSVLENILTTGYTRIFGGEGNFSIFLYTFLGMITFIIGLYVWKTWRGNPD